jgi:hypothetical protein
MRFNLVGISSATSESCSTILDRRAAHEIDQDQEFAAAELSI